MVQAEAGHSDDVVHRDLVPPLEGHQRRSGPVADDITANTVDIDHATELTDLQSDVTRGVHLGQELPGLGELLPELVLLGAHGLDELGRVLLVGDPIEGQLGPLVHVEQRADVDAESKAIEELRSELSLGRVPGPDHDELGRVHDGHTLALDRVLSSGGGVQHHVDQPVVQQVDLVDVEDAPVGLGEQPRLVRLDAFAQRLLNVNRSADPVLRGSQGQLDERGLGLGRRQRLPAGKPLQHVRSHHLGVCRVRVEVIARHDVNLRQQVDDGTDRDGLSAAAVSHDEDSTDRRVDDVEQKRQLHILLSSDAPVEGGNEGRVRSGERRCSHM